MIFHDTALTNRFVFKHFVLFSSALEGDFLSTCYTRLKWPSTITRLINLLVCDLMYSLVICTLKEYESL